MSIQPEIPATPIATGRTAEIYALDEQRVLKLFRPGWPSDSVDFEEHIARTVNGLDLSAPLFHERIDVSGRDGLIYERISGQTLIQRFEAQPWRLFQLAHLLAELHHQLHKHDGVPLPSQRERYRQSLLHDDALPSSMASEILAHLESLPDGSQLCHGDFHPENVLMTPQKAVVIDWVDAVAGNPWADVARTSLLFTLWDPPGNPVRRALARVVGHLFRRYYLAHYTRLHPEGSEQLLHWEPVVMAARLHEGILEERSHLIARLEQLLQRTEHGI